ncbi:MAG: ATP-binding protein [Planctomycetota bacterium]
MKLEFLDRSEEIARLRRMKKHRDGAFATLYGRRRCGKSRLLQEVFLPDSTVFYVADERESPLQREGTAREIARLLPGFDRVIYPDWDALFRAWWETARPGMSLVLDEFPYLASAAPEVPSILQKRLDAGQGKGIHLVLCGSSQRMMQGLILDRTAPLYGRADEILRITPIPAGWIRKALSITDAVPAMEAYAVWGGIPRYWELASECQNREESLERLVFDPLGVLHGEADRLLQEDMRETAGAVSILSLIGSGCHRPSEIASRLGKPATALSRPLQRLIELDLVRRDCPFGASPRDSKQSLYRISDPFLRFWFRFAEPERTMLEARRIAEVADQTAKAFPTHVAAVWEDLARAAVPRLALFNKQWRPAAAWWGNGLDRKPMEIDIVSESTDGKTLLLGEATWSKNTNVPSLITELKNKAERLPFRRGRNVRFAIWCKHKPTVSTTEKILGPADVLDVLT